MKYTAIFLSAFFLNTTGFSQSFNEGNLLIKGGLGIGSPYYYAKTESTMPPLNVNIDYAIKNKIGIGGILGIASSKYSVFIGNEKYLSKQSYKLIGGRATYHLWTKEHYDVYIGAMLGFVFPKWKEISTVSTNAKNELAAPHFNRFVMAGFAGVNYSVNNDWGVFGEVGYSLSYLTAGAYLRLGKSK
jgi:hypothetical protein